MKEMWKTDMREKTFFNRALILVILLVLGVGICAGCAAKKEDVTILYTNDVHTYINNTTQNEAGEEVKLLSYASVAAMKKDLESKGENVLLVDAGDHSQGTAFGGLDEGASIIKIMNKAGFDVATFGNHEFDYGMFRTFAIMDEADFPYISCNFFSTETGKCVVEPYYIAEIGGVKIGFVGITTPETLTKSSPTYFQNEKGEFIYGIYAGEDGSELYSAVQRAIDEVKPKVDYCIGLGHLGIDPSSAPYTSREVIANTAGFDAFIDGHSHSLVEGEKVPDKDGREVILTQAGNYLNAIGQMTIASDGTISTKLITEYPEIDSEVDALTASWVGSVNEKLGEQIAVADTKFFIMNPENEEERIIRRMETNVGDLLTDSFYYYFNEIAETECDVVIANSGGIRSNIEPGPISYLTTKTVCPFGNVVCMIEEKGQNVIEALEKGAMKIGMADEKTGALSESGGFLQVAGLKYDIDASVNSTVSLDDKEIWLSGPSGQYKVSNVEVYNRSSGTYEPIDPNATYRIAGINFILRNQGDGFSMFANSVPVMEYVKEEYLLLSDYLKDFQKGDDGIPHISSENSPLSKYPGYLIDYENPFGAGRITINNLEH